MDASQAILKKLEHSVNIVHNPVSGWVILCLSLVLTVVAFRIASHNVEARAEERFIFHASEISHAIKERLDKYEQALRGGVGLFNASKQVDRMEWQNYVNALRLDEVLPGIQGLGFAMPLKPEALEQHVADIQSEGFKNYRVKPPGKRDQYSSIIYLEPFNWRNQRAFGYDMWSNDLRRQAMSRARDTGLPSTSAMITLVQETDSDVQKGFLTYLPVYKSGVIPSNIKQRQDQMLGWVYAAFRASDLMKGVLGSTRKDIAFEIFDGKTPHSSTLLFDSDNELNIDNQHYHPAFKTIETITLQGRPWTIAYSSTENPLLNSVEGRQPIYVLIAGILVDILLFYVIVSLHFVNRHSRKSALILHNEHEKNQQALKDKTRRIDKAEKEAKAFFDMAPDAFLIVSQEGLILRANRQAHKMFLFKTGELDGRPLKDLIPTGSLLSQTGSILNQATADASELPTSLDDIALTAKRSNGTRFPVTANLEPLNIAGDIHTVAAIHDMSTRQKVEKTLAEAKERAESASQAKSEFVANMSHEIRTPLNAILGSAQILEKTSPSDPQKKYLRMIKSSGEALLGIISDILDFSKIEAGRMTLDSMDFKLDDLLEKIAMLMTVSATDNNIELVIHTDARAPVLLNGDVLRLQQILINLISNAVKFTKEGYISLEIKALNNTGNTCTLEFSVCDSGIGMEQAQIGKLFKAFSQADESITRRFGGTGLGLVISSKLLELMNSQFDVESEAGKGARFTFRLDLPVATLPASTIIDPKQNALILESKEKTARAIIDTMKRLDWPSKWCSRKDEFLKMKRNELQDIDFVLLSSNFDPEISTIIRRLVSRGLRDICPIILVVENHQHTEVVLPGKKAFWHAYCTKPLTPNALKAELEKASAQLAGENAPTTPTKTPIAGDKKPNIKGLLVEDNYNNQIIAKELLDDIGIDIDIANNGREALDILRISMSNYDIIFMDIQMPEMDGLTATKILRHDFACTLPIVAMTAAVLKSEQQQYLESGMNALVAKPIDAQALASSVSEVLKLNITVDPVQSDAPPTKNATCNTDRLNAITKGKPERVKRVISTLREIEKAGVSPVLEAKDYLLNGKSNQAKFILHSLKGMVANYGGEKVKNLISDLERKINENTDVDELMPTIENIQEELKLFILSSSNWAEKQQALLSTQ